MSKLRRERKGNPEKETERVSTERQEGEESVRDNGKESFQRKEWVMQPRSWRSETEGNHKRDMIAGRWEQKPE